MFESRVGPSENKENKFLQCAMNLFDRAGTLADIRGLDAQEMEVIYAQAYHLYWQGRGKEAECLFQFLCFYNHWEKKYWLGMALSRQALKHYRSAIESYSYVGFLDKTDPQPPLQSGYCYLALNELDNAYNSFSFAMQLTDQTKQHQSMKKQLEFLLNVVEQKKTTQEKNAGKNTNAGR